MKCEDCCCEKRPQIYAHTYQGCHIKCNINNNSISIFENNFSKQTVTCIEHAINSSHAYYFTHDKTLDRFLIILNI